MNNLPKPKQLREQAKIDALIKWQKEMMELPVKLDKDNVDESKSDCPPNSVEVLESHD